RAVMGWAIDAEGNTMPNGAEYRMIGRIDGGNTGGLLTLTSEMLEGGAKPGWIAYFHVPDVDAALAKAVTLGATVWMGAQSVPNAGRMAMLADPQGAPFYIMTPTPPPDKRVLTSDVFDAKKPGHCRWMQ